MVSPIFQSDLGCRSLKLVVISAISNSASYDVGSIIAVFRNLFIDSK